MARNLIIIQSASGGTVHEIGRVRLVDGRIEIEGPAQFIEELHEGIASAGLDPTILFPSDGRKFLDALPHEFSGGYVRASFADDEDQ